MIETQLDPVAIRKALEIHRNDGVPWREAWRDAAGPRRQDQQAIYEFMTTHFKAAYLDTPSSLGRCKVAERDTSDAVPPLGTGANAERDESIVAAVWEGQTQHQVADAYGITKQRVYTIVRAARRASNRKGCRWGDGCDLPATRGSFGPMWCEKHGTELERLALTLEDGSALTGNYTIFRTDTSKHVAP